MDTGIEYKKQRGEKSKPVVWGIQLPQDLSDRIEKYALTQKICEGDVFRRALWDMLGKPLKPRSQRLRGTGAKFTQKTKNGL